MQHSLLPFLRWPSSTAAWRPQTPAGPHAALASRATWNSVSLSSFGPVAVVVAVVMAIAEIAWGLGASGGAAICAAACVWTARRADSDRPVWVALAVACVGLAAGSGFAPAVQMGRTGLLGPEDIGYFVFGTAAAAANLAWPEMRRASWRVLGTLLDTVTLVVAAALWGASGFPPFGNVVSAPIVGGIIHASMLAIPSITAYLAVPQVAEGHRRAGISLGLAMTLILMVGILGSREMASLGGVTMLLWPLRVVAFTLLAGTALRGGPIPAPSLRLAGELARPPLSLPGLASVAALLAALFAPTAPPDMLVAVLVGTLCLREALHVQERRRAQEQLEASLDLEAQLLAIQGKTAPEAGPTDVLRESCRLATEVLKADAALAWMAEGDVLILSAVAPDRRDTLVGRRLLLNDTESLAPRVFRASTPEVCEVRAPGARVDRVLAMVLDAGTLLGVPIQREGTPIGTLVLVRERSRPSFSHFDMQRASLIVAQVESALRRLELYEELEGQLRETTLIHRFAVQAVSAHNVNDVAWYLLESIRSRVPIDRGAVFLTDDGSRMSLTPVAHFHPPSAERGASGGAESTALRAPLQYGEAIIGYVDLTRHISEPFTAPEADVVERLAQQAAVAIQNVRLQEVSGKVSTYRELDRLKTELLNAVSHDLRGPLGNIKGYASTLVESEGDMSDEERRDFLITIEEEADRLRDLLDHLLDLSKIEAGVLKLELQPVQLARIVDQTLSGIKSAKHTFEFDVAPDLFVMADGRRLRQILHNLVENAVKYSPDGGPISILVEPVDGDVTVSVIDCGVGIPRHQWDRVFRPYQRADTAKSRDIAGTGLGLAICKGIVEAQGGRIWVESEPGRGTIFSFTVPRALRAFDDDVVAPSMGGYNSETRTIA